MSVCGFVLVNANTPRNHHDYIPIRRLREILIYMHIFRRPTVVHDVLSVIYQTFVTLYNIDLQKLPSRLVNTVLSSKAINHNIIMQNTHSDLD